jgi:hypothetical protein
MVGTFIQIIIFYGIITLIIGPFIGYQIRNNFEDAGHGFVIGSIICIILWELYGRKIFEEKILY